MKDLKMATNYRSSSLMEHTMLFPCAAGVQMPQLGGDKAKIKLISSKGLASKIMPMKIVSQDKNPVNDKYVKMVSTGLSFTEDVVQDRCIHMMPYDNKYFDKVFEPGELIPPAPRTHSEIGRHNKRGTDVRHMPCNLKKMVKPQPLTPLRKQAKAKALMLHKKSLMSSKEGKRLSLGESTSNRSQSSFFITQPIETRKLSSLQPILETEKKQDVSEVEHAGKTKLRPIQTEASGKKKEGKVGFSAGEGISKIGDDSARTQILKKETSDAGVKNGWDDYLMSRLSKLTANWLVHKRMPCDRNKEKLAKTLESWYGPPTHTELVREEMSDGEEEDEKKQKKRKSKWKKKEASLLQRVYNISPPPVEALDPYSDDSKAPFYRQPAGIRKKKKNMEKEEADRFRIHLLTSSRMNTKSCQSTVGALLLLLLLSTARAATSPSTSSIITTGNISFNGTAMKEEQNDDHFALIFKSNPRQMRNVPVYFKNPVPSWLQGTLVRNGLGKFENGDRTFLHAFDGFAKLASWRFLGNGTVLFSTRFVKSRFYKDSMQENTIAPYLLFQSVSPPFGYFEKLKCLVRGIDNMNVNVYEFKNPKSKKREFAVLSDFWILYKISITKLSTKYRVIPKIQKNNKAKNRASSSSSSSQRMGFLNLLSSAHPLPEPGTNNHLTFLSSVAVLPWQNSIMNLIRIKSLKRRKIIAQWPIAEVPYMHSFSVTQTKAIILASPLYVNIMCMAINAQPFYCLDWHPDRPAMLYIVTLKTGQMQMIQIPSVFTMHHVNAYDESESKIVMDISSYPSPDFVKHLQLHVLRDPVKRNEFDAHARLKRIKIDLSKKSALVTEIGEGPSPSLPSYLDMPAINEFYRSKHYCFVYGLVLKTDNMTLSKIAIVKKDVCYDGKGDKVWQIPGDYPVEPWFVARPNAADEDDGILMVPVLRGTEKETYLVFLDAKTFNVINQAKSPTLIPYSLHGRFFPNI